MRGHKRAGGSARANRSRYVRDAAQPAQRPGKDVGEVFEFMAWSARGDVRTALGEALREKERRRQRARAWLRHRRIGARRARRERAREVLSRKLGRDATDADMRTAWIRKQHDKYKAKRRLSQQGIAAGLEEIANR